MMADVDDECEGYVMHGWSHVRYAWNAKLELGFSLHNDIA
jgi:hypothetical protein